MMPVREQYYGLRMMLPRLRQLHHAAVLLCLLNLIRYQPLVDRLNQVNLLTMVRKLTQVVLHLHLAHERQYVEHQHQHQHRHRRRHRDHLPPLIGVIWQHPHLRHAISGMELQIVMQLDGVCLQQEAM